MGNTFRDLPRWGQGEDVDPHGVRGDGQCPVVVSRADIEVGQTEECAVIGHVVAFQDAKIRNVKLPSQVRFRAGDPGTGGIRAGVGGKAHARGGCHPVVGMVSAGVPRARHIEGRGGDSSDGDHHHEDEGESGGHCLMVTTPPSCTVILMMMDVGAAGWTSGASGAGGKGVSTRLSTSVAISPLRLCTMR